MKMNKKGQVTVFIILGILIVATIGTFLILKSSSTTEVVEEKQEVVISGTQLSGGVQIFIEQCMKKTAQKAVTFIGERGGYYNLPEQSDNQILLPFYIYKNDKFILSEEELKQQLGLYMEKELPFCLRNFVVFKEHGYEIKREDISAKIKLGNENIFFLITLPITISKDVITTELSIFETSLPSRLKTIYGGVKEFIQKESNHSICISCLTQIGIKNDLQILVNPIGEDKMMFTFIDNQTLFDGDVYEYTFLNNYNFVEQEKKG